ncbi:MAG: GAF domain-containing protein [Chloroflexota bacterium]|nr:GAF domain-containing protein [Chloroflexota bacterium]
MKNAVVLDERRAALLQAGAEVSRKVSSILDPERLLSETVDVICDEFDFYYAGVFLVDETDEWAVLHAGRGEPGARMLAEGHKLRINGPSMIGAATGRADALIALDVGEEPVHFKNPHLPNTRSEMALPLKVGDKVIGALTVQSVKEAAFSDDDITALQAMADQLAIAIDNSRLYDRVYNLLNQLSRRTKLLQAAAHVGRDVTSILDLDELLNNAVGIICDAYDFYYAGVFLVDAANEWAVLRAGRGEAGAAMIAGGHKLKIGGHSMIGASIAQRKARIALDVGEEPVHFKNPHLPDTRSEMALPLIVRDDVIGALTVQSVAEAAFSDYDITSLQAMADQLAVAINNARLLKELEAAHAELVRTKTFEALATATIEAIHWIGNKALPISASVGLLRGDLARLSVDDPVLVKSMREDLAMIDDSARMIVSVQEHLIGSAREEKPRPTMVDDVLEDAAAAMGIPADIISYTVAPDLPLALADTTQLSRAFGYVLDNALEAMAGMDDQCITVGVSPTGDGCFVAVRVADTGPGIPEEELDKIWATFYTTKGAQHAGLGLSACLQILKQIDGQISAANLPDGGAVIELLIPAFDGSLPAGKLPTAKSILLIDDDDAWSRFAEAALTAAGNTVIRSAEGHVDPVAVDLVLVDDVLETSDSQTVLKQLSTAGEGAKTLVVASSLRVERVMELMQLGVRDVLLKPYTTAELAKVVA